MLTYFVTPLRDWFSGFTLLRWNTSRGAAAAVLALVSTCWVAPLLIRWLTRMQIGEAIRSTGPASHQTKKGTPTMGGTIILVAVLVPTLLLARLDQPYVLMALLSLTWMGFIGFLDDYLKDVRKYPDGLIARYKLVGQISLGVVIGGWLFFWPANPDIRSSIGLPFVADGSLDVGFLYIPLVILVITGSSRSVRLTYDLEGLPRVYKALGLLAFDAIASIMGRVAFSDFLNIFYLPGTG